MLLLLSTLAHAGDLAVAAEPTFLYWPSTKAMTGGFAGTLQTCGGALCFDFVTRVGGIPALGEPDRYYYATLTPALGFSLEDRTGDGVYLYLNADLGPAIDVTWEHPLALGVNSQVGAGVFLSRYVSLSVGIGWTLNTAEPVGGVVIPFRLRWGAPA